MGALHDSAGTAGSQLQSGDTHAVILLVRKCFTDGWGAYLVLTVPLQHCGLRGGVQLDEPVACDVVSDATEGALDLLSSHDDMLNAMNMRSYVEAQQGLLQLQTMSSTITAPYNYTHCVSPHAPSFARSRKAVLHQTQ